MSLALLIFDTETFSYYYNCSTYDVDLVPLEQRRHVFHAIMLFLIGLLVEAIYMPCVFALFKMCSERKSPSCYYFMLYLGVVECLGVIITCFMAAFFSYEGHVYCANPVLIYITCQLSMLVWFAETSVAIILALNRCIVSIDAAFSDRIFSKQYVPYWMMIPTIGALSLTFASPPNIYNAIYGFVFFNPHQGYLPDNEFYYSSLNLYYNWFLVISITVIYIIMCTALYLRFFRQSNSSMRQSQTFKMEIRITTQVLFTCVLVIMTSLGFIYIKYLKSLSFFIMVSYVMYQGTPAIIYLLLNLSIRKYVFRKFQIETLTSESLKRIRDSRSVHT